MTDPVARLITAWLAWEAAPAHRSAVVDKQEALAALRLPATEAHERIAAARRAGFDVPSAVQRVVLDLADWKEAC